MQLLPMGGCSGFSQNHHIVEISRHYKENNAKKTHVCQHQQGVNVRIEVSSNANINICLLYQAKRFLTMA
jgi:hypothetical protein